MFPSPIIKDGILESPTPWSELKELDTSFAEFLLNKVDEDLRINGDRPAMIDANLDLTNLDEDDLSHRQLLLSEVVPLSRKFAKAFYNLGLREGDIVHIALPNVVEFSPLILGIMLCQGIASIVDPDLNENSCADQINDTKPKLLLCHEGNRSTLEGGLKKAGRFNETQVILFNKRTRTKGNKYLRDVMEKLENVDDPPRNEKPDMDKPCMLVWSSGTTSRSKAAIKDNLSIRITLLEQWFFFNLNRGKRICCTSAFFHGSGLLNALSCCINNFTMVFVSAKDVTNILRVISKYQCSILGTGGGPFVAISRLSKDEIPKDLDLSSLTVAWPAGTYIPKNSYELMKNVFPNFDYILNVYGMSEIGFLVCAHKGLDCMGNVHPGVKIRIVNPDNGHVLGANQVGEIQCFCEAMSPGYYGRPEETAKMYTEDNFYRTGDLGHYDEKGSIHYDGRLKELIKSGPKQAHVYPSEIENVLVRHPQILDAGVFGKMDEKKWTEVICAVIVKKSDSSLTENDVIEYVEKSHLEDYQYLSGGVAFAESIPRNPIGKIGRGLLKKCFEQNKLS